MNFITHMVFQGIEIILCKNVLRIKKIKIQKSHKNVYSESYLNNAVKWCKAIILMFNSIEDAIYVAF